VHAYSRSRPSEVLGKVHWHQLPGDLPAEQGRPLALWVRTAPIWLLPRYFAYLHASGVRRIVALSSTSVINKINSTDEIDKREAQKFADAERQLKKWAEQSSVEWVIIRPTMIYGLGLDKNVALVARFIKMFGFFPLFGKAVGLRQPVQVLDVVSACTQALRSKVSVNKVYNIYGFKVLTYREMVSSVFIALGLKPKLFPTHCFSRRHIFCKIFTTLSALVHGNGLADGSRSNC